MPYRIAKHYPLWALPLRVQQKAVLDTTKHPFYTDARMKLFVAYRDGRAVGRIAAIDDDTHNRIHKEKTLHFGFFDCEDDKEVASALFAAVERVAKTIGHDRLRGPFSPSVNDEIGVQIDAFDTPNYIMIPANPPYYRHLVEAQGFEKSVDLFCYKMTQNEMKPRLLNSTPHIEKRLGIKVRKLAKSEVDAVAPKLWEVHSHAWEKNWYWTPMNKAQFLLVIEDLKQIADYDLVYLAETNEGHVVGFAIALPNINEALIHIRDGRLWPFGILKLLWHTRPGAIRSLRVLALGVLEDYRGLGIDSVLYDRLYRAGKKKGYAVGEFSQILETNRLMNAAARMMGARVYKTHRMYEKPISASGENADTGFSPKPDAIPVG